MSFEDELISIQEILGRRFYGNVEFYKDMVHLFVETGHDDLTAIRASIAKQNWDEVQFWAHHLKGGAANVGADCVRQLAERLERLSFIPSPPNIENLISELETAIQSFEQIPQRL